MNERKNQLKTDYGFAEDFGALQITSLLKLAVCTFIESTFLFNILILYVIIQ